MAAAGYISLDREGRKESFRNMQKVVARIREGASVLIFPEGTRSRDGKIHPFKKGGFTLAIKAGVPIVPISIRGSWDVLSRDSLRVKPGRIEIIVDRPIRTDTLRPANRGALMAQVRDVIEANFSG
jgi:1-acyl-sn-glycerol-3-phosphate acyltransferase